MLFQWHSLPVGYTKYFVVSLRYPVDGSPSTLWEYARWPLYPGNEDYMEPVITPPQLIYNLTPSAKIIIILRNPTDR